MLFKSHKFHFLFLFIFGAIFIAGLIYAFSYFEVNQTGISTHGPRTNFTSVKYDPNAVQQPSKLLSTSGQVTNTKTSGYGIAAGGDLIFLDQTEIDSYFVQLKELGVEWVRWDIDWPSIQPNNSAQYNWKGSDMVAEASQKYGIKSLGIITYTPKWARSPACIESPKCAPANPDEFANFSGEVAKRYKDKLDTFEIWNEPNYSDFWLPSPNAASYTQLLKKSYTRIKQENSSATVISGGLASAGDDSGNIAPITFTKTMYSSGAKGYFDAIAIHPYSYPALPSYIAPWNRWQQIIPIYKQIELMGDQGKQVWITEYGAPTNGEGIAHTSSQLEDFEYQKDFVDETTQAQLLQSALLLHEEMGDIAGPFFYYSLKDAGLTRNTTENFYGLLRYDGSKKPAYYVFKNNL